MIEYPLFPRDVCPDQWWPDVDDSYPDECTDQRHPPDMPDVRGWDRLSANPGRDVVEVVKRLAQQAGLYMIYSPHQRGESDHNPDPVTVTYAGQTFDAQGFGIDVQYIDEMFTMNVTDPTVETPQTKADILAWKKKRNTGPPTEKWTKRGRKKK